jgi:hypothetical protein
VAAGEVHRLSEIRDQAKGGNLQLHCLLFESHWSWRLRVLRQRRLEEILGVVRLLMHGHEILTVR